MLRRFPFLAAVLLPLSACVPPTAVAPARVPITPDQGLLRHDQPGMSSAPAGTSWWTLYDDPLLGQLVQQALRDNLDLEAASARVAQARSVLDVRRRQRLPSTQLTAGAGYGSTATDQLAAALDDTPVRTGLRYDAGLDFSWDTDLNGRLGASVRQARAHAGEVQARADGVRIDVAVETARAYVDICGYAARVIDARRSIDLLNQSLAVQRKRLTAGAGNRLDVVRTQGLVDEATAALPDLQAAHDNAIEELAVLLGKPVDGMPAGATDCHAVPQLSAALPVGDVGDLLKRRPDVRAADQHLRASTAGIDIATAELYPSVSIGAGVLSSASHVSELDARASTVWRIGPLLSWRFPNVAVARAQIAAARADQRAALADFDQSILRALASVRTALNSYAAAQRRREALQHASTQTGEALTLAQRGQSLGAVDALDVLDAERSDVAARLAATASDANVAVAQLGLFRALGGGWQATDAAAPAPSPRSGAAGSAP
ncbi:TolC family protein [Dyella sp.]|uniref:TolC family protein n=1 Tax=Dyella sp. TaxID=1869338 RepID=UPI002845FF4E|nr:TolC family protein [Dyella sp.]MDR3447532.1 TolC family protein [Dyella sp.]